jgi:hypothetical protein
MTDKQQFKKPRLETAMAHIQAQYIEDGNLERFQKSVWDTVYRLNEAWTKLNEPSYFESLLPKEYEWEGVVGMMQEKPKERCKPSINEWYWTVRATGNPLVSQWHESKLDMDYWAFGNVFPSEQAAIEARDKVKSLLLSL